MATKNASSAPSSDRDGRSRRQGGASPSRAERAFGRADRDQGGGRQARGPRALGGRGREGPDAAAARIIERALTDNFGHADWMAIVEARSLFDGGRASMGGVVIGEAYRVDQDASVHRQFDPRNSTSWGQGGQAPLLIYDLSFGATHGIAFAGSGGFKTVSVARPPCSPIVDRL